MAVFAVAAAVASVFLTQNNTNAFVGGTASVVGTGFAFLAVVVRGCDTLCCARVNSAETHCAANRLAVRRGFCDTLVVAAGALAALFASGCVCAFLCGAEAVVAEGRAAATTGAVRVRLAGPLAGAAILAGLDACAILCQALVCGSAGDALLAVVVCCDDTAISLAAAQTTLLATGAVFAELVGDDTAFFFKLASLVVLAFFAILAVVHCPSYALISFGVQGAKSLLGAGIQAAAVRLRDLHTLSVASQAKTAFFAL